MTAEDQGVFTGDLDEAAVAGYIAAARADLAVEPCCLVGPDNDPAAVARAAAVGVDHGVACDHRLPSLLVRPLPLKVTADQRLPTAGPT